MRVFKTVSILIISIIFISCGKKETSQNTSGAQGSLQDEMSSLLNDRYANDAYSNMKNMYTTARTYYNRMGTMPADCYEEMENAGAIEMKQNVIDAWDFQCDWKFDEAEGEILGTITATSTENNDAGPGKVVEVIISDKYEARKFPKPSVYTP